MNFDLLEAKYSFKKVRHLMNLKRRNSRKYGVPAFVTHEELDMISGMLKSFKRRKKNKKSQSKYMKIRKNEKSGVDYFLNKPISRFRKRGKKRYPLSFFLKIKKR